MNLKKAAVRIAEIPRRLGGERRAEEFPTILEGELPESLASRRRHQSDRGEVQRHSRSGVPRVAPGARRRHHYGIGTTKIAVRSNFLREMYRMLIVGM